MTRLYLLTSALQLLAAITAVMVARSRQDYRPVALFLGAMVVANAVKTAIRLGVLVPARSAGAVPFKGWIWAAAQAESALFLSWSAGFAALAVAVFVGRRARGSAAAGRQGSWRSLLIVGRSGGTSGSAGGLSPVLDDKRIAKHFDP